MNSTQSSQNRIVRSRVQNQIQLIKHSLSRISDFDLYNDILIISQIVPKLPEGVLVQVLQTLKTFND